MYALGTIEMGICTHLVLLQWVYVHTWYYCNGYMYALGTIVMGICTHLVLL